MMKDVKLIHDEFIQRHNDRMAILNSHLKECQETIQRNSENMVDSHEENQRMLQDIDAALDALLND